MVVGRVTVLKPSSLVLAGAVYAGGVCTARGETVMISLEADGKTRRAHKRRAVEKIIARDAPEVRT